MFSRFNDPHAPAVPLAEQEQQLLDRLTEHLLDGAVTEADLAAYVEEIKQVAKDLRDHAQQLTKGASGHPQAGKIVGVLIERAEEWEGMVKEWERMQTEPPTGTHGGDQPEQTGA